MNALLHVDGLSVAFGNEAPVVTNVSFTVGAGECVAIVGESGSGKSVTARALLGLAGRTSSVTANRLEFGTTDLGQLRPRGWRGIRGSRIGLVLQDALVSLDPLRPVWREINDALRFHTALSPAERRRRVIELLDSIGMPDPVLRAKQLPGALSGGLRQRALIAAAIAADPPLLIADEPTTALDVSVQARVLDLLDERRKSGTGLLLISHDLAVVARLADRVIVMRDGMIVEDGTTDAVLTRPQSEYTRRLIAAVPSGRPRGTRLSAETRIDTSPERAPSPPQRINADDVVLQGTDLSKRFRSAIGNGASDITTALDNVSFSLHRGETLGIVGESGSGKSTLARIALAIQQPDSGTVRFLGEPWSHRPERERRPLRRRIGVVYQDTLSSFDPRWNVARTLLDALPEGLPAHARRERVAALLDNVGLTLGIARRKPSSLSGGQRQRVAIARALAAEPDVLILDEPVSALDVTVQAHILDLLDDLQRERTLSYLLISHDIGVIRHMSDRILVMRGGQIVESGDTETVLTQPQHPYTAQLIADTPKLAETT